MLYAVDPEHHHVLVTGAAARPHETRPGIGFAIARLAASHGHRVSLLDVSSSGLGGAEAAFASEGLTCQTEMADVGDFAAVEEAIQGLTRDRPVTALVNAAALLRTDRSFIPFSEIAPSDVQASVRTNVLGVLNAVRAVLPGMLDARAGVVVNIGSIAAAYPASGMATYAMTKAAVRSLTGTLAAEVGRRGVHVQGLAPGVVRTGLHDSTPSEYQASLIDGSVRGRAASTDELARTVMTVVESPDPAQAGHMVAVDGGLSPHGVLGG